MKKLLSVTVLLALVLALVPVQASAGFRGTWDPLTNGGPFFTGLANGAEQPALRQGVNFPTGGHALNERWYAFSTRSTIVGSETSRSIWIARNQDQVGFRVADILDARRPLLLDPTAAISYLDPAWSHDGKYLAYVQSDKNLTTGSLYVQEYMISAVSAVAATAVGAPILVATHTPAPRLPSWKPDNSAICYSALGGVGLTPDIWTVSIDAATATVGVPARATTDDTHAEVAPDWGPGNQIVYATNKFGRNVLEIIDMDDMSTFLAEANFANVSHNNPSWTADGASIYYDAPQNEDTNSNTDIWKLDLASQSKCDIFFDNLGDSDPDVSPNTNTTIDGIQYNTFLVSSIAGGFGQCVWRGTAVSCAPALAMGVALSPTTLNLDSQGNNLAVICTFPPETKAEGYWDAIAGGWQDKGPGVPAGFEGVKNRRTIVISPSFLGLPAPTSQVNGSPFAAVDNLQGGGFQMNMNRRTVAARLVALGLVNQLVPCETRAYSESKGREFRGFGFLRIAANNLAGQAIRMEQNYPNPFNPATKVSFATSKPGHVNVRIFNVRGELVKTIASGYYGAGSHEASWDGSSVRGKAPTGIYFAKASVRDDKGAEVTSDVIKMVMTK